MTEVMMMLAVLCLAAIVTGGLLVGAALGVLLLFGDDEA